MEKEIKTSGKMTWAFIWRFVLYYIVISIILAVILYFLLGKINNLVLAIFSIITMAILIFIPTKLATSDIFKTQKMDDKNLKRFKRNIIIFYFIVMIIVSLGNALSYALTIIGLEDARVSSEQAIEKSEDLSEDEKNSQIQQQNDYVNKVISIERETFIIITIIDAILFVFGVIIQFKFTKQYITEDKVV